MRVRVKCPFFEALSADSKRRQPMKRAIRISILMVGLVGTFVAAAVQQVPAADGGPILVCPPGDKHCKPNLPPMMK